MKNPLHTGMEMLFGDYCIEYENSTVFCDEDKFIENTIIANGYLTFGLISMYLLFCLKLGKQFMENREPFKLRKVMIAYNIFQVIFNTAMLFLMFDENDNILLVADKVCHPPKPTTYKPRMKFLMGFMLFLFNKMIDLLDTVFMVLRKKYNHITYLHLFHHTAMVICVWLSAKYLRGEIGIIFAMINLIVHLIMYSYYLITAMGPRVARVVAPFKPYITRIQIGQFGLILGIIYYMIHKGCEVQPIFVMIWSVIVFIILVLFINFYIQAYIVKDKTKSESKKKTS